MGNTKFSSNILPTTKYTDTITMRKIYNNTEMSPDIAILEEEDLQLNDRKENSLLVYNDDYNTFSHVIETLVEVCAHSRQQAEQCTYIIHFKGKCAVKQGSFEQLVPMRTAICDRGISAKVV